jgi:hypothetical protein
MQKHDQKQSSNDSNGEFPVGEGLPIPVPAGEIIPRPRPRQPSRRIFLSIPVPARGFNPCGIPSPWQGQREQKKNAVYRYNHQLKMQRFLPLHADS